ncbi:MAG TPA: 4-(cytidine 5'-diphospho)-2-C-methyl-D-erythritol kinase [Rhodocyclaceae bacterium]|jgi:4-diphosphocytidyl-2-C-methyl-D-erythritol kinase|nr:4-(cytidine 5'-diphospho)-2-C-methyl-D-erythritol kinase [Rhodocyclaceae bacterium]
MTRYPAPAKINLFLHVVGRRSDGYHLLQTVFRFLDFGDSLSFDVRDEPTIALRTPIPGVPAEQDLTVRAAKLLQQATGTSFGAEIQLEKHLPMGGGLGGGSSDAATTLVVLNHLWQTGLSRAELEVLGLQLGADVPIFVHGHSAFAEGVGEAFLDVVLPPAWYLVLIPPVSVPTAAIFTSPDLCRSTLPIQPDQWRPGQGHNDLEAIACRLHPEVAAYLNLLRPYGTPRMSGSGACVFAEFTDESNALRAQAQMPSGTRSFVARGIDQHPLLGCLT